MLLSEFENLTDIKPDSILYSVIEKEYNAVDGSGKDLWTNKAQFCHAFKFDEDGLAEKCQRLANESIWRKDEQYRKAMAESAQRVTDLHNENQKLIKEIAALETENTNLEEQLVVANRKLKMQAELAEKARAFDALCRLANTGSDAPTMLHSVFAYQEFLHPTEL